MLDYLKFHPLARVRTVKNNHGTVIFAAYGRAWVKTRKGQHVLRKFGDLVLS